MDRKIVFLLFFIGAVGLHAQQIEYRKAFKAMGSAFEVVILAGQDSALWATSMVDSAETEIRRIERLISSWDPNSETSRLNQMAGREPIMIDQELADLIWRSVAIYKATDGAFDITYAGMASIWDFSPEKINQWPDSSLVDSVKQYVNADAISFYEDGKIALEREGMRIGFGGIGKGYAADKTAKLLRDKGVKNGVINASGDLYCWGHDESKRPWRVAVVDPKNKQIVRLWLEANNQAVVTSGDYEKYKMHRGKRYAHIINPKTGYPVSGMYSATVIAPSAGLADALATAIFVLGREAGIQLINQLPNTECVLIDSDNRMWTSANISVEKDD